MTNEQWQQIEQQLRQICGDKLNPISLNLHRSDQIEIWLNHGMSLELDIYPAIKKTISSLNDEYRISSWRFFDDPVRRKFARRKQETHIAPNRTANSKGWGLQDPPEDPVEVRKRAVARWREIRDEYR